MKMQPPCNGTALLRLAVLMILALKQWPAPSFATDTAVPAWKHLSSQMGDLPVPNGGEQQTACLVRDIDKDGCNDIIIAERSQSPALVWLRNRAPGWQKLVIEGGKVPIAAGGAFCDIDSDGDLDLVFGSSAAGSEIWWWENPFPHYDPSKAWKRRVIAQTSKGMHHDQLAGDFLSLGRPQIVSWSQGEGKLLLFLIPTDPRQDSPWPAVTVVGNIRGGEGLAAADVDGDGQLDLIGAGRWFQHEGGTRFTAHLIDPQQTSSRAAAGDLKKGGHPEVALVMGDGVGRLKWYECLGDPARTGSWQGHDLLGEDVNHGHSLGVADIDGDGNLDIFCAEMAQWTAKAPDNPRARAWIFYGDGRGNFRCVEVARGFDFHEAKVADVNHDGQPDIVDKPFMWQTPRIDLWLNQGPKTVGFGDNAK